MAKLKLRFFNNRDVSFLNGVLGARAGDIDGSLHWCNPVDAPPFIPFAAGCCHRGSERGEGSEETGCPRPLAWIVVTFSQC